LMHQQPERLMGVYATSIEIKIPIQPNPSFWELAHVTHTKIHKSLKNLSRVLRMLVLDELNPLLADNIIEAVSTEQLNRLPKILTRFIRLDPDSPCLTISNIGRVDLPSAGTNYPLETLFSFMPTGAGYNHSICAMTVNNQMHLALRFHQLHLDQATITKFKERIKAYLLLE